MTSNLSHVLVFSLLLPAAGLSSDFYISPTGNDSTGDGTIGDPWLTLEKIDAKIDDTTIGCSDTVYLRGGTYTDADDGIRVALDCSSGTELTIRNYQAETPVFQTDGTDWGGHQAIVYLANATYIIFQGFEHRPAAATEAARSVYIDSQSTYNKFVDFTAVGGVLGDGNYSFVTNILRIDGDHNEFDGVVLANTGELDDPPGYNSGSGLYIIGDFNEFHDGSLSNGLHDNVTFVGDYNKFYDNVIDSNYGYGFEVTTTASYNLIERNTIKNIYKIPYGLGTNYGKNFLFLKGDNNTFRQNSCYDSYTEGIVIYTDASAVDENLIYNNVFYNIGNIGIRVGSIANNGLTNTKFANNVLMKIGWSTHGDASGEDILVWDSGGTDIFLDADNNLFSNNMLISHRSGTWQDDYAYYVKNHFTTPTEHSVSWYETNRTTWLNNIYDYTGNDPEFANPSSGDFCTTGTSALIDAGIIVSDTNGSYVETNYPGHGWGNLAYSGSAPDVGVCEYTAQVTSPVTPPWIDPLPPDPIEAISGVPLTHRHLILRRVQ